MASLDLSGASDRFWDEMAESTRLVPPNSIAGASSKTSPPMLTKLSRVAGQKERS
jgi:hypothetical protein